MRVTALIADDEPLARAGLRDLLSAFDWVEVVGEAANGPAAVEAINRLRPELVFLDVQMPGMLGTDVLRHLSHQPFVLFTTAFAQHAVTAFELGALDYLLKPFGPHRLAAAMARVRTALGEPAAVPPLDRMGEALNRLEERLDPARFTRIHRAHLVNMDMVRAFRRSEGRLVAELVDGTRLPVSRAKAQELRPLGA